MAALALAGCVAQGMPAAAPQPAGAVRLTTEKDGRFIVLTGTLYSTWRSAGSDRSATWSRPSSPEPGWACDLQFFMQRSVIMGLVMRLKADSPTGESGHA